jgi:hypothetical protein
MCAPHTNASLDMSLAMPSLEYVQLAQTAVSAAPAIGLKRENMPATNVSFTPATLPDDLNGFYMKTWACREDARECEGPPHPRNVKVVFSGYAELDHALDAAVNKGNVCTDEDMKWCNGQAQFLVNVSLAATQEEAEGIVTTPGAWTESACKRCFAPAAAERAEQHGVQFLAIGGANAHGILSPWRLESFWGGGLEAVKAAGFHGICFDVELTQGEPDKLAQAMERAFSACKQAGLLVMVTTSHSAPYATASANSKAALVNAWVKSKNIDLFSPQLFTSGLEKIPEFETTPCDGSACTYERLRPMKAKWIPSLSSKSAYPATRKFFASLGIHTHGYLQW